MFLPNISPHQPTQQWPDRALNGDDVLVICFLVQHGENQAHLAREYHVDYRTIRKIVSNESYRQFSRYDELLSRVYEICWKEAVGKYGLNLTNPRMKLEVAHRVLRLWRDARKQEFPSEGSLQLEEQTLQE